jgi:hypothetical protein
MRRAAVLVLILIGAPLQAAAPVSVPFQLLITKHIVLRIKVNAKGPYRVIFDTGAPVNLLSTKLGKEAGLIDKDGAASFFGFLAGGQSVAKSIEIGGLIAKDVPVIVMDHPTIEAISQVLGPIEGIVGFPFFARYRMTLDYQARRLTLVPSEFEPPDVVKTLTAIVSTLGDDSAPKKEIVSPQAQWGIVLEKADDDRAGVRVRFVWAKSPADAAGIRAGDRLLSLDGRWTDSVMEAYQAGARVKPGTAVTLIVARGKEELWLVVRPRPGS